MNLTFVYFIALLIIGVALWSYAMHLIIKRKQIEDTLRESQVLLKNVLDTIPNRVFWKDLDSRYLGCNKLFAEDAGLTFPAEIIGKQDFELSWSEQSELYRRDDRLVMDTGNPKLFYEEPQNRTDGKKLWLETSKIPLVDKNAKVYGVLGTYRDITERKVAEDALRQAKEEAEEATKVKDKLVTLVAHDLKNPLFVLSNYLEMTETTFDADVRNAMIQEGKKVCNGMIHLVNEILNLTRVRGGRLRPKFVFTDARTLIEDVVFAYRSLSIQKGLSIINEVPPGTRIYADYKLLYEVLANLVSNAIKFSKKGGTVRLFLPGGEASVVAVADTGVGIEETRIEDIFKFEEKTSTLGTCGEIGTGLGLPLADEIMKAHRGRLYVESEVGKGSIFYVTLPQVKPQVLIVDDEEMVRESLMAVLNDLGAEFIQADSGESALEVLKQNRPHLIITDIMMPGMGGFGLLKVLKKEAGTADIPVIVITGDKNIDTRSHAFRMGASDFISKPFSVDELIPRVIRYI